VFVKHLSATLVAQQSVTKIMPVTIMNLVTPKDGAKHELLFNKPVSWEGFDKKLALSFRGGFVEHPNLT
jgi:hypothetical protein